MRTWIVWVVVAVFVSPLFAARGGTDGTYTVLGRMDSARYLGLGAFKPLEDIQKADGLWARREYEQAEAGYAKFVATYANAKEDAFRAVAPYATLMQGACLAKLKKHEPARAKFDEVAKLWPNTEDATLAQYQCALSYRETDQPELALGMFEAVAAKADKVGDKEMLVETDLWLVQYYGQRRKEKAMEAKWLAAADALFALKPTRGTGRLHEDLLEHFAARRDWAGYRKVAGYRMTDSLAETFVIDAIMQKMTLDLEEAQEQPEKLSSLRAKLAPLVKDLQSRVAALKAHARYEDLVLRLIGFCCRSGLNDGNAMIAEWMADHPDDRMALYAFGGYVRLGGFDAAAFDKVFLDYLKAHPKDGGVRDLYARVIRDLAKDPAKATALLKQYGAGDWDVAEFWRPIDPKKAAAGYVDTFNDQNQPADRRSDAAWLAAEMFRALKEPKEAIPYYIRAEKTHPQALDALADCYYETGQWKEAVEVWKKVAAIPRNRNAFDANLKAANALLENKDPEGPKFLLALAKSVGKGRGSERVVELAKKYGVTLPEGK